MNFLDKAWTPSTREETLFVLYSILAVLCFAHDHIGFGWFATVKAALCLMATLFLAFKEARFNAKAGAA